MALVDEAIQASGGMDRWKQLNRFTLQLSIDGDLFSRIGQAGRFKDVVAEGSTRSPWVRLTGFADRGECGLYQPDRVSIENPEGIVVRTRRNPHLAFRHQAGEPVHDELYLVFLCGVLIWNCLATPFILADSGVTLEELPPWHEHDQTWRRLHAVFPPTPLTQSSEQTFYFDAAGLRRRIDHDLLGIKVAHSLWAHQMFCGIGIPTLRRVLMLGPDGTMPARSPLIDVEIFDAAFE